ncbi:MAG TPA: MlaD family protein [Solirubrobacteraceae bacterium]|jgi:virulence factor Mce-like protein|nr:MlaD family protein [Solirubrobacteraceae bacterium]
MNKQRPSNFAIFTMFAFTASCVGLLIFLWLSFGGSLPLAPQGYRVSVEFDQGVELGSQAQVQISGVPVGRVVTVSPDRRTGLSRAVLEIDRQFVPRPADTHAILRAKTLLGETYVELSPGSPNGAKIPDGGSIPQAQVAPTVQLDQIFSTFDPATRSAFETWMQQGGIALTNRGQAFNAAFADLYPFATNVDSVLSVLRRQGAATSTLLRDGGQVFSALSRSPAALQSFVRNSNTLFAATAARNADLAATIRAFPAFLAETRSTINRLTTFSQTTKPLVDELRPAAVQLTPVLQSTVTLAPELRSLMVDIAPLTRASRAGFPALSDFLNAGIPFLVRLKPYLGGLVPVIDYINAYRAEVAGFFANSTATTEGTQPSAYGGNQHYLRISNPINPELLTTYPTRPSSNRSNAYLDPGGYNQLVKGLSVFGSYLCTSHPLPTIGSSLSQSTTSVTGTVLTLAQLVARYYYTPTPGGPPCTMQAPLGSVTAHQNQSFPHLQPLP